MPLNFRGVHIQEMDSSTGRMVITRVNPYTRLVREGEPPVLIQAGRFYSDGGDNLKKENVPSWVKSQIKQMTPEGRSKLGISLDEKQENKSPIMTEEEEPDILVEAIKGLDPSNNGHWTGSDLPDLQALREATGIQFTRAAVSNAVPGFKRPMEEPTDEPESEDTPEEE